MGENDQDMLAQIPEGLDFVELLWKQEDECEKLTDQLTPQIGVKAPQCLAQLGTVLSLLDRLSSCWWGCQSGDHLVEYLVGRAVGSARAVLRLLRFGFYDEALAIIRNIGEIANLLFLFRLDRTSLNQWQNLDVSKRKREFGPVGVRCKLEAIGAPVPINQERYSQLCEVASHVNPQTKPQAYNLLGKPWIGAVFQLEGVLVTLNEVSIAIAYVARISADLAGLHKENRDAVVAAANELANSIGGVTITGIQQLWDELRESLDFEGGASGVNCVQPKPAIHQCGTR